MLFPTLTFGLFFLLVFSVTWAARGSNEWRKILLLLASWVFYGAWDWRFVALLIVSALLNWGAARLIERADQGEEFEGGARKAIMLAGVVRPISASSACSNITISSSSSWARSSPASASRATCR
jgi:alginate O-acetyltransferase complex protein AlgI